MIEFQTFLYVLFGFSLLWIVACYLCYRTGYENGEYVAEKRIRKCSDLYRNSKIYDHQEDDA